MFPRYERQKMDHTVKFAIRFPARRFELIHDLKKCVTCTICSTVCPTGAIELGPVTISLEGSEETLPLVIDEERCVWCGVCDHFCPFGAIELHIDGQHDSVLARKLGLPTLDAKIRIISKQTVFDRYIKYSYARGYFEGELIFHSEKCHNDCVTCANACIIGAIDLIPPEKRKVKHLEISLNETKCNLCGACVHACKVSGAIELTRKEVRSTGERTEIWEEIVNKLTEKITS
ncbi:MAG: 4Fe-4S dicluster domain-containing protein [Candidatus Heimdallarchaeota archaeon]